MAYSLQYANWTDLPFYNPPFFLIHVHGPMSGDSVSAKKFWRGAATGETLNLQIWQEGINFSPTDLGPNVECFSSWLMGYP